MMVFIVQQVENLLLTCIMTIGLDLAQQLKSEPDLCYDFFAERSVSVCN